ncbi:MAG: branched-chain amino acid ABC transporter permease [Candidatus Bathyarchaeia archaeon]
MVVVSATFKKRFIAIVFLSLALISGCIPSRFIVSLLTFSFIYACFAQSWNLLFGFAGCFSFGHSAFFGLGAFITAILFKYFDITPYIGIILGGLSSAAFGLLFFPILKLRAIYFGLSTSALALIIRVFIPAIAPYGEGGMGLVFPYKGPFSLYYMAFNEIFPYYYISLAFLLAVTFAMHRLSNSRIGFFMYSIRDDEDAAKSLGVNARSYKFIAVVISGFIAGICGGLYSSILRVADLEDVFGPTRSVEPVLLCLFGGAGTIYGPILGGICIEALRYIVHFIFPFFYGLDLLIFGILLYLVITFSPEGIISVLRKLKIFK